jgi:transglutaminase superfamily protein
LRALRALPARDVLLLLKVGLRLAVVRVGLRVVPLQRLHAFVARGPHLPRARPAPAEQSLARLVWAVEVTARYLAGSCLTRALTLQWMLSRRGVPTRLWVGVKGGAATGVAQTNPLAAHAWLEHGGKLLIGGTLAKGYARLGHLDGAARESPRSGAHRSFEGLEVGKNHLSDGV